MGHAASNSKLVNIHLSLADGTTERKQAALIEPLGLAADGSSHHSGRPKSATTPWSRPAV
jgi:hypothetical protein